MFDFKGTFNASQFERFVAFAKEHLHEVSNRISHLNAEVGRVGVITVVYDSAGVPTGYKADPPNSYIGRLLAAYEVLGGDVLYDLQVRPRSQPVFLRRGDEVSSPKILSNGEPLPEKALADAPSAILVGSLRGWVAETISRRETLERKIRRSLDYSDQLLEEVEVLKRIVSSVETSGSLEKLVADVRTLLSDKTYRAIADDKGRDPYGKFVRAPFTAYEPGPARPAPEGVGVQRGEGGYLVYGEGIS